MPESIRQVSIEEVLREADWLRALARDLVSDAASADDVAQETLLRAIRKPPAVHVSLRAWMARVARNTLVSRHRRESRRLAREQVVSRVRAIPTPIETVARAEEHRRVVDAALSLREPFRSVILMRYFDDLTPKEIADRTGTTPATVRSRLHRGRNRLRSALESAAQSAGRDWRMALLPLLVSPRSGAVGKASAAIGGVAMAIQTKVALVAVVLVLVAGVTIYSMSSTSEVPVQPETAPLETARGEETPARATEPPIAPAGAPEAEETRSKEPEVERSKDPATPVPDPKEATRKMESKVEAALVTVKMDDTTIRAVLEQIERDTGIPIWIAASASDAVDTTKVNINFEDTPLSAALRFLSMYGGFESVIGPRGIDIK